MITEITVAKMARIIPGVQVTVIKEVVPPQLAPSGVLGLVGLAAPPRLDDAGQPLARKPVERVGSWGRFRELYGRATAWAMPEAQQALQNGVFELVVTEVESSVAARASAAFTAGNTDWLTFEFRCAGTAGNGPTLRWVARRFQDRVQSYELTIEEDGETIEVHRNLSPFRGSARWVGQVLNDSDSLVRVQDQKGDNAPLEPQYVLTDYSSASNLAAADDSTVVATLGSADALTVTKLSASTATVRFTEIGTLDGDELQVIRDPDGTPVELFKGLVSDPGLLGKLVEALAGEADLAVELVDAGGSEDLAGGVDATVAEYTTALDQLVDVADVDLVIASVQELDTSRAAQIYGAVIAHCENMSADAKGRIGFGQVPAANTVETNVDLVGSLISDRFVMFAPHGVMGAAVGRIGSLSYFQSPTFKGLAGLGEIEPALRTETLRSYLRANIVPIAELPGRGNVVVRGLTSDGDQINVRRVADRAVRGVKQIGELFIGKLNTEDGRNALKQKLNEFLLQMAAENAIVPSTDGSDPAFKLDVYSTQADFALGVVRVDLAVRPVRAIDFIYATVLVQV